jgi:hypothetical protein
MTPLESTRVREVGYNPTTRVLRVAFVKGGMYEYKGVPPHKYQELTDAYSPGAYMDENIKGQYEAAPYTPPEE